MPGRAHTVFTWARAPHTSFHNDDTSETEAKWVEPKKVIVTTSFRKALGRCWLHCIPILTSITILTIDVKGVYIGEDFTGPVRSQTLNLMFLQLAAKAHELFIVASLGLIVLQTVRHELLFGDGLPLGLIGSGLSFGSIGFFFKKEFYGAIKYIASRSKRTSKLAFIALLIIAGLTATLAGPASAVLLVPQNQPWSSGGTDVFLPAPEDSFWPADLSGDMSELEKICASEASTGLAVCPAGGFESLYEHWTRLDYTSFDQQNVRPYARNISGANFYWPTHSPKSLLPPLYSIGNIRQGTGDTFLIQPHAAAATVFQQASADWWAALTSPHRTKASIIDDRQVVSHLRSAFVTTRCAKPEILKANDSTAWFPVMQGRFGFGEPLDFVYDNFSASASTHLRFNWVHLPPEYGAASVGAIIESPWSADSSSRLVMGCTAQCGWVPTNAQTDAYTFWSGWYPWNVSFGERTPSWSQGSTSPTNGRVALGDAWLKLLTPTVPKTGPGSASWQPSTMESILDGADVARLDAHLDVTALRDDWLDSDVLDRGRTAYIEALMSSMLVDGLSRTGSRFVLNATSTARNRALSWYKPLNDFDERILAGRNAFEAPPMSSNEFVTLHMKMAITGFAFQRSLSGYLAITVLSTHMLMATAHIIWILVNKQTSSSWNSISELIALAQNSQPAYDTLANTSAGVERCATFTQLAKIRVRSQPGHAGDERVELVFQKIDVNPRSRSASVQSLSGSQSDLILMQPSLEVTEPHQWQRSSLTWPTDRSRLHVGRSVERHSRSSSTERLVPRVYLVDEGRGDVVVVNRVYG